ncbi:MAG: hypothetical protein ACK4GL_00310 [Flavobacteriales bacterium]
MLKSFIICLIILVSHFATAQKIENKTGHIPTDFYEQKTRIVYRTIAGNPPLKKAARKAFEKYYTGSYEILSHKDDSEKKHDDSGTKYYSFQVFTNKYGSSPEDIDYSIGIRENATLTQYRISFYKVTYGKLLPT